MRPVGPLVLHRLAEHVRQATEQVGQLVDEAGLGFSKRPRERVNRRHEPVLEASSSGSAPSAWKHL